jgi:hypothetical protein
VLQAWAENASRAVLSRKTGVQARTTEMDDTESSPLSGQSHSDIPQSNLTSAGVSGKVPKTRINRGPKRKPRKMSSAGKRHVKSLMKRGSISSKAASFSGLKP